MSSFSFYLEIVELCTWNSQARVETATCEERQDEKEGKKTRDYRFTLSLSLCIMRLPHKRQFSLIPWGNEEQLTCSLNCLYLSFLPWQNEVMNKSQLLGSDWIWEFCELLWSLTHYTHCHLRLSLKIPNPLCPWIKIRKNYWEQNKPLPCGVVREERSEWLSKMDHRQERDWWGETRSGASSIQ